MALNYSSGSSDGLPDEAKPDSELATLIPTPTEWVTVLGAALAEGLDWGIASYLIPPAARQRALADYSGVFGAGGSAGISITYPEQRAIFEEGLEDSDSRAEFFVQRRHHHGRAEPTTEFRPSFLWYFDAIPRSDGSWYYLDDAGRDHELVRVRRTAGELRIDIASLPLRRYLAARQRLLVVQLNRITRLDRVPSPKIEATEHTDLRHFSFHSGDIHSADRPGFVRLLGKQVVLPLDAAPETLTRPHPSVQRFPEFTIGVDPGSGQPITSTCDPDQLSDYFTDRGTPHYLTRVYFRRTVLNRYTSQPSRYRISDDRLSCLGFWSIAIGTNPEGMVEVYLGDLGRDLPTEERDHWVSFNAPPGGGRDDVRYRRDILGEWFDGPPDPLRELFAARERFSTSMTSLLGKPVYNSWNPEDQIAFEGLHVPTTSEQGEADNLILRLTKGVVDYLDVKALRQLPGVSDPKAASINCLDAWVTASSSDNENLIGPLRLLQGLRSTGSAHARGKNWNATLVRAGLENLRPDQQFIQILDLTAAALNGLAELAESQGQPEGNSSPGST
ncbi:hypothetical protein [Streptacidiphilus melanogenes]|uniref:hypothetical protein n=1 Tax=Streptacidiphilus melanogenes TaxID=411235 RepID=UPI0005A7967C|nr:hypothetical protein [Streptacidiphilus melanogenes]